MTRWRTFLPSRWLSDAGGQLQSGVNIPRYEQTERPGSHAEFRAREHFLPNSNYKLTSFATQ